MSEYPEKYRKLFEDPLYGALALDAAGPISLTLTPDQALTVVAFMQLGLSHPQSGKDSVSEIARSIIETLERHLQKGGPEITAMIRDGWKKADAWKGKKGEQ